MKVYLSDIFLKGIFYIIPYIVFIMGRKKKIIENKSINIERPIIVETKKHDKVEVIEKKIQRNVMEDIPLESLVQESRETENLDISPSLRLHTIINNSIEPLEADLSNVAVNNPNINNNLYTAAKGGDYSPKDNYSAIANKAYESVYPGTLNPSVNANFSASNNSSIITGEGGSYPGVGNKKPERQYESSIEDNLKEQRKRSM